MNGTENFPYAPDMSTALMAGTKAKFDFWVESDWKDEVASTAKRIHLDSSKFARKAIDAALVRVRAGQSIESEGPAPQVLAELGLDQHRLKYLSSAPCGPWREAVAEGRDFVFSADVADELESRDGDYTLRAEGQSMEEAGIQDGWLVLARPLPEGRLPRSGEIAVVQAVRDDEVVLGTIKFWHNTSPPTLRDGAGREFELPEGTERLVPVATIRGVIGRL